MLTPSLRALRVAAPTPLQGSAWITPSLRALRVASPTPLQGSAWITPSLRALRVASPTPLQGATPAARQSRFCGVLRGGFLITTLVLCANAAHADATLDKIKQRGKLAVGVILSGPPFGTIDPVTQKHIGYNVELSEAVAKGLGVALETVQVQPSNRVQFLQQGKVDILIANMQWTQERSEILSFVPTPFEEVGGAAISRKGSGITKWEDLRGKPVCVSQGSNFTKPLADDYGAQIKAFRGQPESLLALRGGNCVTAVHVSPTLRELVSENADWKDFEIISKSDLIPSPSVIWLRKGEGDTQTAIDKIVQQWHRSGWLIEVEKKNGMTPTPLLYQLHDKFKKAPV